MRESLLEYIRCPKSGQSLAVESASVKDGKDIVEGVLSCDCEGDVLRYAVNHGIPNLLTPIDDGSKIQTLSVFGHEWERYSYWGWLEQVPEGDAAINYEGGMLSDAKRMFRHKTQIEAIPVPKGSMALDVGCGNGRHSYQALEAGHENVISLDASEAIYIARENFRKRGINHTHFVRGNALNLPLRDNCVDHVFSIGVMQHTGDARRFLAEQKRVVKPLGALSLNCYGTGTRVYEVADKFLRFFTTRMSKERQKKFAEAMAHFGQWVWDGKDKGIKKYIAENLSIQPTSHHMFDWYSPMIAEHYAPQELMQMFHDLGLSPQAGNYEIWQQTYDDRPRRQKHFAFCVYLKNQG